MNTWGNNFRITVFGESHGPAVGVVIDGLPAGTLIDADYIAEKMARRAPGRDEFSTSRKEPDKPVILSGVKDGRSTGAPLTAIIENTNTRSQDYDTLLRPSHADWTAFIKYGQYADRSGGGRFSGRLTAPLVFAGAIAQQILQGAGIYIYGRIKSIGDIRDEIDLTKCTLQDENPSSRAKSQEENTSSWAKSQDPAFELDLDRELSKIKSIANKTFPADDSVETDFKKNILEAKQDGDSVGGSIEVVVVGNTAGIGEPFFDSIESTLSGLYFSVPAVKGVEFGRGFEISTLRGSEANDPIRIKDGKLYSAGNNNGGILGGIANGMPIISRVAIKPTASISKKQDMVDAVSMSEVNAEIKGRHDPCIVPRAVPVIEAVTAIGLLDLWYEGVPEAISVAID
jgi:chorismate synthase